jgi:hypothetical protein
MGLSNDGAEPKELQYQKTAIVIGKMMIKLDMGSSISDTSIFCIRNPYRGSAQDEEF